VFAARTAGFGNAVALTGSDACATGSR